MSLRPAAAAACTWVAGNFFATATTRTDDGSRPDRTAACATRSRTRSALAAIEPGEPTTRRGLRPRTPHLRSRPGECHPARKHNVEIRGVLPTDPSALPLTGTLRPVPFGRRHTDLRPAPGFARRAVRAEGATDCPQRGQDSRFGPQNGLTSDVVETLPGVVGELSGWVELQVPLE